MPKPGLRKTNRYSDEFKVTAVKLSSLPDVLIQDVAYELDIHPFMLSRWRKAYREGRIVVKKKIKIDPETAAELKRLRALEREHARLKVEHDLLKKAIRFSSEQKQKSLRSSTDTESGTE